MAYREPRPEALRSVLVSTSVPRPIADKMQALATAQQCSVSQVMREALVQVYAAERRDA